MLCSSTNARRGGAVLVEAALVYPLFMLMTLGMMIGGMGVFRYAELAHVAREAARYASTHGAQYRSDTGQAVGNADDWAGDVYQNAILPNLMMLDRNYLNQAITWPEVINQQGTYETSSAPSSTADSASVYVTSTTYEPGKPDNWPGSKVTVTLTYQWFPGMFLVGPITLTSTSSMPMMN